MVLTGLMAGLAAGVAVSQLIKNLLFGVTATYPITYASGPLVLASVSLLACILPARRAARVDPLIALRQE